MELKEYQQKTLKRLKEYLNTLEECSAKKRQIETLNLDLAYDIFEEAWKKVTGKKTYQNRKNGLGEDIPQICLKVPTGGGKTLLATLAIDSICTYYLKRKGGLVLWIVPTDTIYHQTLRDLRNREHPYRQNLDRASGGRTLILEKGSKFSPIQLQEHLAVLLLMLPSANRRDKETLKIFQDTSGFEEFFPPEDDAIKNKELATRIFNLDRYDGPPGTPIYTSLGNTLRLLKPLIIIDEGHKTYSENAQNTIRSFNPSFVLELSATPTKDSNILVSISGQELNREQMIKLDLNVYNLPGWDWKEALAASVKKLDTLRQTANEHRFNGGCYIRPICLIQVERTGKEQLKSGFIHAEDAKTELIRLGVNTNEIAIKSSENDGLENIDLLSEDCSIRFILTRQALQEGWDCPFAYILTVLTNPGSQVSITQLVGRILRQPYTRKTGVKELDESYVYCYRQKAGEILDAIRRGFDEEGLGDLSHRAYTVEEAKVVDVNLRPEFKDSASKVYLPRFVIEEDNKTRLLSYEMDILSRVDWSQINLAKLNTTLGAFRRTTQITGLNLEEGSGVKIIEKTGGESQPTELPIEPTFVSMQLADIVPNPWVAYEIARQALTRMIEVHGRDKVANDLILIINDLKLLLDDERDRLARQVFEEMVKQKNLRFVLNIEDSYRLPNIVPVRVSPNSRHLTDHNNRPLKQLRMEFLLEEELNSDEQNVAVYLDRQEQLILWWDRNFSRAGYYLQGWQKNRIYADFFIGKRPAPDINDYAKVIVLETKGRQLEGNQDTIYKQDVFKLCNELAKEWDTELRGDPNLKQVEFHFVFHDKAESEINAILQG